MSHQALREAIEAGRTALGIELGSTRIKAVLIGPDHTPVASGAYDWENRLENGLWTYRLDDVWTGLREAYRQLHEAVRDQYGAALTAVGSLGISGMMHGYLPFDRDGRQLASFRTWRNTNTERAAEALTELFGFNIPLRWSIAHLYQAMMDGEAHVKDIAFMTTLSGYVHWKLTGERTLGVGDASGMFPIDSDACDYNASMAERFDGLLRERGLPYRLSEILPRVLAAGEPAGVLTAEGAKLLDPSGALKSGIPMCPPEGDAGTGMVATNSVAVRTGNVSAGTSIFAMVVLEKELSRVYTEIDMVTTPAGRPVAMVHSNTCTSDLDAWVRVFGETAEAAGASLTKSGLYELLYNKALEGDADCGGLLSYNYYSGEPITGVDGGRPLFVRRPDARFTLANFMRAQINAALAVLRLGMDILFEKERVRLDQLLGHGGLFKTRGVGQRLMAGALGVPVAVMETAGEGGPWGIALLAAYRVNRGNGQPLEDYLSREAFAQGRSERVEPGAGDVRGFNAYIERYVAGLPVERAAVEALR